MRTAVRAPKNRVEVVPSLQNEGAKPLIWPRFSPFQRLGHLTAHPPHIFCDAAARSTFQPATLCRITRNTLPRPRTLSRFNPSRFFKPLLVDSMPERRAYRSVNTGVSCSRRRPARRWALSVNSKV